MRFKKESPAARRAFREVILGKGLKKPTKAARPDAFATVPDVGFVAFVRGCELRTNHQPRSCAEELSSRGSSRP
jgi:hypothetical protein